MQKAPSFILLVVLLVAFRVTAADSSKPGYSVGAGSLDEAIALYAMLTDQRVENCVWGMLRPFDLSADATRDAAKAVAELEAQFKAQNLRLIAIGEKRQVVVWQDPKAITKIHVGDLLRFYSLLTGRRVDLVQQVQFWVDLPAEGLTDKTPATWIETAIKAQGAQFTVVDEKHVVVSWEQPK